jgi:hypothetical protein
MSRTHGFWGECAETQWLLKRLNESEAGGMSHPYCFPGSRDLKEVS